MSEISDILTKYSFEYNFEINDLILEKFEKYAKILIEWNKKINLTSIVDPQQIAIKHFLDSLVILKYLDILPKAKVIDVGTGAGFPGIPLKILREDIDLTLLDSLNKRINFLNNLLEELNLKATTVHGRAEETAKSPKFREKFDIVTSRAVAPMNILSEYCLPFVKLNGSFIALKSSNVDLEINDSKTAINILGGKFDFIEKFNLPENNPRALVNIKKILNTKSKYPRISSKIAKNPL